jgi:hypothetical protein
MSHVVLRAFALLIGCYPTPPFDSMKGLLHFRTIGGRHLVLNGMGMPQTEAYENHIFTESSGISGVSIRDSSVAITR